MLDRGCFQPSVQVYVNASPFKNGADSLTPLNTNFNSLFHKYLVLNSAPPEALGMHRLGADGGKNKIIWPGCILLAVYTSTLEMFFMCVCVAVARLSLAFCVAQTATR